MFTDLALEPAGLRFVNLEGGGIEQQRDQRLQLHHCANYAAALLILRTRRSGPGILELGCGTGALSHAFARHAPKEWHLVATDYSEQLVDLARTRHKRSNLSFEQLDARTLEPGELSRFDAVLMLELIEHLPRKEVSALLRRLHSGLRSGAVLLLSTLDRSPFPRPFSGYAPHCVEYTFDSLCALLADPMASPFQRYCVYRLVSPRIAAESVRAEAKGGYLANRIQRLALGLASRSRALDRLYSAVMAVAFRLYGRMPRRGEFDLEGYLSTLELVRHQPEKRGRDSFGLVAVLERC